MRDYEPIWLALKELSQKPKTERAKGVSITQHRALHARTLKAVVKEKWQDYGFKLLIEPKVARLTHSCNGSILTFYLEITLPDKVFRNYTAKDF